MMKSLLYAIFLTLNTAWLPLAQAFIFDGSGEQDVEVVDLTEPAGAAEETPRSSWLWQRINPQTPDESTDTAYAQPLTGSGAGTQIALLLPLTGQYAQAADAIRDGFISAYYQSNAQADVRIYDTFADQDVQHAYNSARAEGADVIVGPLSKAGIETLVDSRQVDLPTVTLNTVESRSRLPRQLYQYSLNPIDEAYALAEQAWYDGQAYAIGVAEDTDWGERVMRAFLQRYEQLGGRMLDVIYYDPNRALEDPVRFFLNIDYSEQRQQKLVSTLGRSVDFQVRPRQDIDFVFLAARPHHARQIPPLMKFYYAQDIPIYGTSSLYTGAPNQALDADLNGVIFCDSPWIVDALRRDPALDNAAKQLLADNYQQDRLFAFGVDAFSIAGQIATLRSAQQLSVSGVTGQLQMNDYGRITRRPTCAQFTEGVPRPLASQQRRYL